MNRLRIPLLLVVLAGMAGCGSDSPTDPAASVRKDTVVADIRRISTSHDCDPNEGNPGDFTLYTQIYDVEDDQYVLRATSTRYKQELNTRNGSTAAASYPTGKIRATWDAPRVDGARIRVEVHIEERDPGLDAEFVRKTDYRFDAEKECWVITGSGECNPIFFRGKQTFREDEFNLFNPDDEGCEIEGEWTVTFEGAS